MKQGTGVKYDKDKPDYSLLPAYALDEVVKALTYGKAKYGAGNWRLLDDGWNRYFAACQRHLWALQRGEKYDDESKLHHAAHAIACALFMIELEHYDKK